MGFPIHVPRDILTEARRLAREAVKNTIRERGEKVVSYKADEITREVNRLVTSEFYFICAAQSNLKLAEKATAIARENRRSPK